MEGALAAWVAGLLGFVVLCFLMAGWSARRDVRRRIRKRQRQIAKWQREGMPPAVWETYRTAAEAAQHMADMRAAGYAVWPQGVDALGRPIVSYMLGNVEPAAGLRLAR